MKTALWVAVFGALLVTAWLVVKDLATINQGGPAETTVIDRAVKGREAAERSAEEMRENLERKLAE